MRTYDSADPTRIDTSNVTISVVQNPSGPVCLQDLFRVTISDNFGLGNLVYNATAVDADGDIVRYDMTGDAQAQTYFYIEPFTGNIYLRRSLLDNTVPRFTVSLYGPGHVKMCLILYANNKGADQPAHPRSLISTFVVRCLDSMICILAISKVSRL